SLVILISYCPFSEKRGGIPLDRNKIASLLNFSNNMQLLDIGFSGPEFTWSNRQSLASPIDERLDQFFINESWLDTFPESAIEHLHSFCSDHSPIVLCAMPPSPISKKLFRFDYLWVDNPEILSLISHSWASSCKDGSAMFRLADKLKNL
ncbi:hypothetical protein LINPERPRIM_LOCUS12971, partial [Linum perenne]